MQYQIGNRANGKIITGVAPLTSLTDIHSSHQAEQSGSSTEQRWENVLLTNLPQIDLTGDHAQALGYQRVEFSPLLCSVDYQVSPEGNGYYRVNFSASASRGVGDEEEITIPADIHLNNDGVPVHVAIQYNSVQFEFHLQEYETQEIEIMFSDEDDDPSAENQTLIHAHEVLQQPDLGPDPDNDDYPLLLLPVVFS